MGAGMPVFSTASTIEPLWTKVRSSGNCSLDCALDAIHVFVAAGLVIVGQLGLDGGRVGAGVGGVERREIVDHADIGNGDAEIVRGDGVLDQIFDSGHIFVGQFDAASRWALSG